MAEEEGKAINNHPGRFRLLIIGFYAWISAVTFGAVLVDIAYSKALFSVDGNAEAFSAVSDIFLWTGFIIVLSGLAAMVLSWNSAAARNLLIASLLFFSLEFLIPIFIALFIQNIEVFVPGPWLRLLPSGLASILAFAGLQNYSRQTSSA
ncbi:MAG TPA: hypothetical protein VIV15_17155 [Anaerolineales bacterium]